MWGGIGLKLNGSGIDVYSYFVGCLLLVVCCWLLLVVVECYYC